MDFIEEEYKLSLEKLERVKQKIARIISDKKVQEYIYLQEEKEILTRNIEGLHYEALFKKYEECNHIFVYQGLDYSQKEQKYKKSGCCLKCGLSNSVIYKDKKNRTTDEAIMYDYLMTHTEVKGIHTIISCNITLAVNIYNELISNKPEITDQEIIDVINGYLIPKRTVKFEDTRRLSRVRTNYKNELLY